LGRPSLPRALTAEQRGTSNWDEERTSNRMERGPVIGAEKGPVIGHHLRSSTAANGGGPAILSPPCGEY